MINFNEPIDYSKKSIFFSENLLKLLFNILLNSVIVRIDDESNALCLWPETQIEQRYLLPSH